MLTRLRDALADPQHGPAAAARLRDRYRVVMVDEFQDTDPIQWEIVRRAFAGHATVILIGDPKQAIYAFRGADVYSYLDAVSQADQVRTLGINWRSDQALVDGLESLMGGAALGDKQIMVRPVRADHCDRRLSSAGDPDAGRTWLAPVRLRVVPHDPESEYLPGVASLRPQIAVDLVADIGRPARQRRHDRPRHGTQGGSSRPTSPFWSAPTLAVRRSATGPGRQRDPRGDARCEFDLHLRRGPGLADVADRAGAAAPGDRTAGRAHLLLRLDLRAAGPGHRGRDGRPHPAGPLVEPDPGRAGGSPPSSRRRPPRPECRNGCWPCGAANAG